MKHLYRYTMNCGRMGDVVGLFVAEERKIEKAIGKRVVFGEILGKHSDVYGTLEESELEKLTSDQAFIKTFQKLGCASGYNPLDYVEESGDDGDDEDS